MFYGVGHTGHSSLIAEVADIDIQGGTGLVGIRVMDEKSLELIIKTDDAVLAIIK